MTTPIAYEPEIRTTPGNIAPLVMRALGAVLIVLAWMAVFWPLVHNAERLSRPATADPRDTVAYTYLNADGSPADGGAVHQAAMASRHAGYYTKVPSKAPRIRYIIPFEVRDPSQPLALYLSIRNSVDTVGINGQPTQSLSTLPRLRGLVTAEPGYAALPAALLKPGANVLTLDSPVLGSSEWLSEFAIGPADSLAETWRWKNLLQTDVALGGLAVLLFALLLCLVVRWPPEDRRRAWALAGLIATAGGGTALLTFAPPGFLSPVGVAFLFSFVSFGLGLSMLEYALIEVGAPALLGRIARWGWAVAAVAVAAAWTGSALVGPVGAWMIAIVHASFWFVIGIAAFVAVALAWSLVRDRGARWFERSMVALCGFAFALDRLGNVAPFNSPLDPDMPLTLGWSTIVGGLLGLSIVLALARAATEARLVVSRANETLQQKLAEREAEIRKAYETERTLVARQALLEERQRIVRDMHDGFGGQLIALSVQIRNGDLDRDGIAKLVSRSLTDLRLIVDSLDSAGDSLDQALVSLRDRIRPTLDAAGIALEWRNTLPGPAPALGPQAILHVFRIVQEAVSNVIRHSGADRIVIEIGPGESDAGGGGVLISVTDTGHGFDPAGPAGKGLMNMRARAERLGGRISVDTGDHGTRVGLHLPPPAAIAIAA